MSLITDYFKPINSDDEKDTSKKRNIKSIGDADEDEEQDKTPKKLIKTTTKKPAPSKAKGKGKSKAKKEEDEEDEKEEEEEEEEEKTTKKSKSKGKKKEKSEEEEDETKEEEEGESNSEEFNDLFDSLTDETWKELLKDEIKKPYIQTLIKKLNKAKRPIYPPKSETFSAFTIPPNKVRVVIVGQDPYHGKGQAHGLSFSVKKGIATPPSLKNIYNELHDNDNNFKIPKHGYLQKWADQGVFLLNAALTVTEKTPNSHSKFGWYEFTDAVMDVLNKQDQKIVFMLWGEFAKKKGNNLDSSKHLILKAGHPSPFSVNLFKGCDHFGKANQFLKEHSNIEIDWNLDVNI